MKIGKWVLLFAVTIAFAACSTSSEEADVVYETPEALVEVDNVLSSFSSSSQSFSTSGASPTVIKGSSGTIIHVNPSKLETMDGSPIGNTIEVVLLELGDKMNMMLNNVTTLAGDELLQSGGAFYIKMWSKGVELKLKSNETLEVEIPKWVGENMSLYYGKKDSLGQIRWNATGISFAGKSIENPKKPINPEENKKVEDITKQEYNSYLLAMQEYKRQLQKISDVKKTFQAVSSARLGWIGAAHVSNADNLTASLELSVIKQDHLNRARFFVVSKESNSVVTANYSSGNNKTVSFKNLPEGQKMGLIGVAVVAGQTQVFQQDITTSKDMKLDVELTTISQEELRRAISRVN